MMAQQLLETQFMIFLAGGIVSAIVDVSILQSMILMLIKNDFQ